MHMRGNIGGGDADIILGIGIWVDSDGCMVVMIVVLVVK